MLNDQLPATPQFPPWMPPGVRPQSSSPAQMPQLQLAHINPQAGLYPQQHHQQRPNQQLAAKQPATRCPEIVWRQTRWPATDAGSIARMPCPAHAQSGLPPSSEQPAQQQQQASTFACLPNGQWAMRVHAQHCQSMWLRNLTQRVDVGESPLAALAELAQKTRPSNIVNGSQGCLFGDDLVEIGRIIRRFVAEDLNEWLLRILDDKQRISFGRDSIQVSSNNNNNR